MLFLRRLGVYAISRERGARVNAQNENDLEASLRQLTLEQIRQLAPEEKVFVRLVADQGGSLVTFWRGCDFLVIEKHERKRKGPLIKAIRPASYPTTIDFRERYTKLDNATIWAEEDGTFYTVCGPIWTLRVFGSDGQGKTLAEVEEAHQRAVGRRWPARKS